MSKLQCYFSSVIDASTDRVQLEPGHDTSADSAVELDVSIGKEHDYASEQSTNLGKFCRFCQNSLILNGRLGLFVTGR